MKKTLITVIISGITLLSSLTTACAATVAELMNTAMLPIGKCLYVYGGAWNEADTGAGVEAMSYGISDRWVQFYNSYGPAYDYTKTKYQIHDGLDCTGYVGWSMYQLFGNTYSDNGYVFASKNMAKNYADIFGAQVTKRSDVDNFKCGDIMCTEGHVYMVLGQCSDKSVVFMHASPPNVSICGTYTPGGKKDSEAVRLAKKYMSTYFSECYKKYPKCERNTSYLTNYDRVRLPDTVLSDTDGYRSLSADVILMDIFETVKVYVNSNRVAMNDSIFIRNDSTFVPLRVVSENLGAIVEWDEKERRVIILKDGVEMEVYIDSDRAIVDGEFYTFRSPVFIHNDKTYIPIRFISENLNAQVDWDGEFKRVLITNR